jgi:hypothetical protein
MFDDLDTAEQKTEDELTPEDEEKQPSSNLYRWAHFPAMLVFGVLIILFHGHPWSWQVAIGGGYTVYVFFFAFGTVLRDADDFLGDPRVPRYAARLLAPHLPILALVLCGVSLWFYLRPTLPAWVTQEGRKGSFWDLLGWLILAIAGIAQGSWMAGKIKRWFRQTDD